MRALAEWHQPPPRWPRSTKDLPFCLAAVSMPLWTAEPTDAKMEFGKVQNLRVAVARLDGLVIDARGLLSFWRQVGRCSRRRGFVEGRELREGCLMPAVGGGLCQLSNAIYQAALSARLEVVERHAHSRVVPGSSASQGLDATVAWNYVDLRLRAAFDWQIRARLTPTDLVVEIRAAKSIRSLTPLPVSVPGLRAGSCADCGRTDCRLEGAGRSSVRTRKAYILATATPELYAWVAARATEDDIVLAPIDGVFWRKPRYSWPFEQFGESRFATGAALRATFQNRRLAAQGGARRMALLEQNRTLATAMAPRIPHDVREVVVDGDLLPFLWESGVLGGRSVTVLMPRMPIDAIQRVLDVASVAHPESTTLADFRASEPVARAEAAALREAVRIVTPHRAMSDLYGDKVEPIDWITPKGTAWDRGDRLLFPGPNVGRKGVYEVRELARRLDLKLRIVGPDLEGEGFWNGLDVERVCREALSFDGCFAVVQPSIIEERPSVLLRAIASGVPVVASPACGVKADVVVPPLDVDALIRAVSTKGYAT